jgi:hypothetical protein
MNDKLERMRKEAVVALYKVLCLHLSGGTEEYYEKTIRIAGILAEI